MIYMVRRWTLFTGDINAVWGWLPWLQCLGSDCRLMAVMEFSSQALIFCSDYFPLLIKWGDWCQGQGTQPLTLFCNLLASPKLQGWGIYKLKLAKTADKYTQQLTTLGQSQGGNKARMVINIIMKSLHLNIIKINIASLQVHSNNVEFIAVGCIFWHKNVNDKL